MTAAPPTHPMMYLQTAQSTSTLHSKCLPRKLHIALCDVSISYTLKCLFADVSRIGKEIRTEINEYYLFHGTKDDKVDIIKTQGFDHRLCRDRALFGTGVYFAESSTKADQYAGK